MAMSAAIKVPEFIEPPPLLPDGVTSIIMLPRDIQTAVVNERYGIAVIFRHQVFRVFDVLSREPSRAFDRAQERELRLFVARRWPSARWSRVAMGPTMVSDLQKVARNYDISDLLA